MDGHHAHPAGYFAKPRHGHGRTIAAVVIIIIIIAIIYSVIAGQNGVRQIGQNYSFTLMKGAAQNLELSNGQAFAIYLNSSTPSMAYVSISSIPVLPGGTSNMALSKGQSVNVSISGSQYSDIELKAVSVNNTGATFSVIQIPKGLKVSSGSQTTAATTTATGTGTTTAVSTSPTTTVNNTALAQAAFNATAEGSLISSFASLYKATQSCTPSLYNSTFISTQHSSPSAQNTYYNVSTVTPYEITSGATEVSAGAYNFTYTTVSKRSSSKVMSAQFSYPSNVVVTYAFSGIFNGLSLSQLQSNYNSQNSIGNSCAALIP